MKSRNLVTTKKLRLPMLVLSSILVFAILTITALT